MPEEIKMGAKQFRDPLVKVLGELTGFKANKAIDHKAVYPAICQNMGITLEQFGFQSESNVPWVERWTQWAFKDLSDLKPALTTRAGKGKWALTSQGAAKAQSISDEMPQANTPLSTIRFAPADGGCYSDPYIYFLVSQATKCYDYFSDQSPTCADCPLRVGCQKAQAAALSDLARAMLRDPNIEQPQEGSVPKAESGDKLKGATVITCLAESACHLCLNPMLINTEIVWVRKAGKRFHIECYDKLIKEKKAEPIKSF